jgi:hypothetical protein
MTLSATVSAHSKNVIATKFLPTRPPNLKSAVTHIQIILYHFTLVQTNVSLLRASAINFLLRTIYLDTRNLVESSSPCSHAGGVGNVVKAPKEFWRRAGQLKASVEIFLTVGSIKQRNTREKPRTTVKAGPWEKKWFEQRDLHQKSLAACSRVFEDILKSVSIRALRHIKARIAYQSTWTKPKTKPRYEHTRLHTQMQKHTNLTEEQRKVFDKIQGPFVLVVQCRRMLSDW